MSKPEAGQWWIAERAMTGDTAEAIGVLVQHILPNGHIVVETYPGTFCVWKDVNNWHHEPRCTGWGWVVPAEPTPPANQPDPDEWVVQDRVPVRPDIDQVCWNEKLFDPKATSGFIRTFRHSQSDGKMHGYASDGISLSVRCRRRDLPPKQPRNREEALTQLVEEGQKLGMYDKSQPAKTRVRLWISALDGSVYFGESSKLRTDCEIYHDGKGFYVEEAR